MSLTDFITRYSGQFIDFDKAYGNQCVDLMNRYLVDVVAIPNPIQVLGGATAFAIYQQANDSRFQKIANTPTGVPQAGDILFWDTSIGSAGHVAIFVSGDTTAFTSFDQNWPVGSACHEQSHDYKGVVGWLHPTASLSVDYETLFNQCRIDRDQHWIDLTAAKAQIAQLEDTLTHLNQIINDRNNDIAGLNAKLSTQEQQLLAKDQTIASLTEQAKQLPALQEQLTQALNDRAAVGQLADDRLRMLQSAQQQTITTAASSALVKALLNRLLIQVKGR